MEWWNIQIASMRVPEWSIEKIEIEPTRLDEVCYRVSHVQHAARANLPEVYVGHIALLALDTRQLQKDLLQADALVHGEQHAGRFLGEQMSGAHKTDL